MSTCKYIRNYHFVGPFGPYPGYCGNPTHTGSSFCDLHGGISRDEPAFKEEEVRKPTPYRYCRSTSLHGTVNRYCKLGEIVYEGDSVYLDTFQSPATVEASENDWRGAWPEGRGLALRYAKHIRPATPSTNLNPREG